MERSDIRGHRLMSAPAFRHSASLRAFTPVFDGLWTRVNALMAHAGYGSLRPLLSSLPCGGDAMLTLYSYPELFGVADNNGYGLKVFAFLRLAGVPFRHEHIFDASSAPRGQLPYIVDDGETIGDSDTIIAHLIAKYRLTIDAKLTAAQRDTDHLIT